MSRRLLPLAALALAALAGPLVTGSAEAPAVGTAYAMLRPPGARLQEAPLAGGGFARAGRIEAREDGLWLAAGVDDSEGRLVRGLRVAGQVRTRRLWLGTDAQGRDLLARIVRGLRTAWIVAFVACAAALGCGTAVGLAAGVGGRWTGAVARFASDALLALPRVLLLLAMGLLARGTVWGVGLAIGGVSWMELARITETAARHARATGFALAARAAGSGRARIALRHVLPHVAPLAAAATPLVATEAILLEATLAYLGVGTSGGWVSWGRIIADGQSLLPQGWWLVVFPGLLLCGVAVAVQRAAPRAPWGPPAR